MTLAHDRVGIRALAQLSEPPMGNAALDAVAAKISAIAATLHGDDGTMYAIGDEEACLVT